MRKKQEQEATAPQSPVVAFLEGDGYGVMAAMALTQADICALEDPLAAALYAGLAKSCFAIEAMFRGRQEATSATDDPPGSSPVSARPLAPEASNE